MNIEVKITQKPIDYTESMQLLEKRMIDVLAGKRNEFLWILEHKTVYTAGKLSDEKDLIDKSIRTFKADRGGKYTVHSPGQKVIYFVLNLNKRKKDIRKLIDNIENCIINILKEYNLKSNRDKKNIGIWVKKNKKTMKIAAIGIKVKKWIAYQGFSLNVNNDLEKYKKIVPCGITDKGVTSLKNLGINRYENINQVIAKNFLKIFL